MLRLAARSGAARSVDRGRLVVRKRWSATRCAGSPGRHPLRLAQVGGGVRRRHRPHSHARGAGGGDARGRVLEHEAGGRIGAEALGGQQVGVWRGLAARDLVAGDQHVRHG